jgi:hypothetical protein
MHSLDFTAVALGIHDSANNSMTQLLNIVRDLTGDKEELQDIDSGLEATQRTLTDLKDLVFADEGAYIAVKNYLEMVGIAEDVNRCAHACTVLGRSLQRSTRPSRVGRAPSLYTGHYVDLFFKEKICTFRARLQSCRAIVQFAVRSVSLRV